MPTTNTTTVAYQSADDVIKILNAIRNNASLDYQNRVPVATRDNLTDIGNKVVNYTATMNEFINALVNRIARVIITSKMYKNPLREFKKGLLEYGETVEEVFVNIAKAHEFDPETAESEVFKREMPDVLAAFHKLNYQNFYKVTISVEQLRQAFLSYQGISDLISRIVESLYSGSEFDEFTIMKQLIVEWANEGHFYAVNVPTPTAENAKSIVTTIKGISNAMEFMSGTYNPQGVATYTKKPDQILIVDAKFDAVMDVEVLASAFNMDKAEFMGRRVLIDNFGELTGAVAALVDKDFFMVFDNGIWFTENYNGQGLYWNYFLHVWKTFSISPFANCVLFTTDAVKVDSIAVSPETARLLAGQSAQFTANVTATGGADKTVTWSVSGATSGSTTITPAGVLQLGSDETGPTLTVKATSVYNNSASGSATVTVVS